jgi:signal transduction histidine kinase
VNVPLDAIKHLDEQRLRRLVAVGRSLIGELRVEQLLDRLLEVAQELTGAQYVALGILDEERRGLARFLTRGIDPDAHRMIGDLPHGRGILGVLIDDPHPVRLSDVRHDPRSYGVPAGHPPMRSFLGVPVILRGEAWGNLYLTEKAGGAEFDEADEASVVVLADWAAIAIENARLYGALDRRRGELERAVRGFEATTAIVTALGAETDLARVLELVVKRGRALVGARSVLVLLRHGDVLDVESAAGQIVGGAQEMPVAGTRCGEVLTAGLPVRIDDVDADPLLDSARLGVPDASTAVLVPLTYRTRSLGVLCAFDRLDGRPFDGDDEQGLRAFAASAGTAVAMAQSVEATRLRSALESAEAERSRWARELHDETLQALGGLKMLLSSAARSGDAERLRAAATEAVEHVSREIDNLRAIIADLRPASLDALGLGPALETLGDRLAAREGINVRTAIELDGAGRLTPELETAVYRVAQEALTNVAKHASAEHVQVALRRNGGAVYLEVRDDGVGFDPAAPRGGFGLMGIKERVDLAGGQLDIERASPGTVLRARFPVS